MKSHYSFKEIAAAIAKNNWGREFETLSEAETALASDPAKLAAYGIVELLSRLNSLASAVGDSRPDYGSSRKISIPDNVKSFPNVPVGGVLFAGDLDEGIGRYVVLAKDENDYCLCALSNDFNLKWPPSGFVADDSCYESLAECVAYAAENDIEYHGPKYEWAKAAKKASETGNDLEKFLEPMPE